MSRSEAAIDAWLRPISSETMAGSVSIGAGAPPNSGPGGPSSGSGRMKPSRSRMVRSASPVSGNLYELDAIGAVVIGGTSLAGGRATIVGTFLGVLTFVLIFSLMTQLNLSTEVQQVTKGLIVLGAVLLQRPEARY